jgi:hypothetical protein
MVWLPSWGGNGMSVIATKLLSGVGVEEVPRGESLYAIPGTYSWTCPDGVTSVSVVCVGGGGAYTDTAAAAGAGGGLGYRNDYSVTPGNSYTVVVGRGAGPGQQGGQRLGMSGTDSYFVNSSNVKGGGGGGGTSTNYGGTYTGSGGGNGGDATSQYGGGGAGGYSGNGGDGATGSNTAGSSGSGGGGGGGSEGYSGARGGGGGVGPLGQGGSGSGGTVSSTGWNGKGGSGGEDARQPYPDEGVSSTARDTQPSHGGTFGGGGNIAEYGNARNYGTGMGGNGCVRIIWPGDTRTFPSTDVGTP